MPKKRPQQKSQRARSGSTLLERKPALERLPTDEIFDGLRDRTLSRKAAVKRLLELDCIDVLQFLDLSWVHTVANTGRSELLGKRTNFAFDISGLARDEAVLFRDWLTGARGDNDVTVEQLEKFDSIAANALKVWISDKRVDSLV
jgi:hypothetical protein